MQIEELTLHTEYLADRKAFYHTLLGLSRPSEAAESFHSRLAQPACAFKKPTMRGSTILP